MEKHICEIKDEKIIDKVKKSMPCDKSLSRIATIFDSFGDSTRIKIISALYYEELCVCDLAEIISLSHSAVSHQLRILRQTDIVTCKKEGKKVYYSLADEHIKEIYATGLKHISHI